MTKKTTAQAEKYFEGIGRRKSSVARVRITPASKTAYKINEKTLADYFTIKELQNIVEDPMNKTELKQKFEVSIKVSGGGIKGQAEAIRLGVSRALIIFQAELRGGLKKLGFLKRDPRVKERRKFGLKKARKAPQWSKR
jgi:small subunit ribosomal protein S9